MPVYVMDKEGVLHEFQGKNLNDAGFSWRAIITVRQAIIDLLTKGSPTTKASDTTWASRPDDAKLLRGIFGNDILFKIGDSNDLHGPWESDANIPAKPGSPIGVLLARPLEAPPLIAPPMPPPPPPTQAVIPFGDTLHGGQGLGAGQTLLSSDRRFAAEMQSDGNFVVYKPGRVAIWSSKTNGKGGVRLEMQGDGNLVVYNAARKPLWASGTNGKGAVRAVMQSDGNLVLYTSNLKAIWASNTYNPFIPNSPQTGGDKTTAAIRRAGF
jgi:hypothetical protein